MADTKTGSDDTRQWFLRVSGETIFGPVTTQGLILWAEQGRVLPGHEVSEDRKRWVSAITLEFLDMRWYVDEGDGELRGPFNRLAAEVLIESGKFLEGAHLVGADELDGDTLSQSAAPPQKGLKEGVKASAEDDRILELQKSIAELEARLAEQQREHAAALKKVGGESAKALEQKERELVAAREKLQDVQKELQGVQNELQVEQQKGGRVVEQIEQLQAALATEQSTRALAERRLKESEDEFNELLRDSNQRDNSYGEKIQELEKLCAQTPEESARFQAAQSAVYELVKAELADLTKMLEREKEQLERFREWSAQRQEMLHERHQKLLRHIGDSPDEMIRLTQREQNEDPRLARLRAEVETLRVTCQQEERLAETREREWEERMHTQELCEARLRTQIAEIETRSKRIPELEEQLRNTLNELEMERKHREEEQQQFDTSQRALLTRINTLEQEARGSAPAESLQATEARNVKLASWMRLKH